MLRPVPPSAPAARAPRGGCPFAATLLALLLAAPAARAQDDDAYTDRRDAEVDARGARRVEVEARAGTLRVIGVDGLRRVRVRGVARASRREWLDDVRLVARREGDAVVVRADVPEHGWDGGWGGGTRALDLVVEVPRGIDARVEDGSGDAVIRGVGALAVTDGSGGLEIEDAESVEVRDGSGELRVADVRRDVRVADGSGGITVARVGGAVVVERDGSGGVDVRAVGGDLVVDRRRPSGITYADVRGRVQVPVARRARLRDW